MLSTLLVLTSFSEYGMTCQVQETELYPVRVNGKEGYIDATGRIVIKPQFQSVEYFSEGLAHVRIGNKSGFIDKTGRFVINPQFDNARGFSEGLAQVGKMSNNDGPVDKWGYIDKMGRIVINPQFDNARDFSEGLAAVLIGDWFTSGRWGYIDKTGTYVINPQFNHANDFREGLASVSYGAYSNSDFGNTKGKFIDKTGRDFFNTQFSSTFSFSEGLARVYYFDNQDGYIDKSGRFVINTSKYTFAEEFKEGLARVMICTSQKDLRIGIWGFIDKNGRCVITPQFDKAEDFSEGISCVRIGGKYGIGKYGYINKTGSFVINPQFDYAETFKSGIAPVIINNKFQYIDKKGNVVWTSEEFPSYINHRITSLQIVEDSIYE